MALIRKNNKPTKRNGGAPTPHHLKPDCRPKFIGILVAHRILKQIDGYTHDVIREHHDFREGGKKECFVAWEALVLKLKRSKKTVQGSVRRLVKIGIFNNVKYRVIERDTPDNRYHDFDTYEEAEAKHSQLKADGLTFQGKPSPLITLTDMEPEIEDFGLKCIDHNRHIYRKMTPEEIKLYRRKKKAGVEVQKIPRTDSTKSSKSGRKVIVNESYRNKTEPNETDLSIIKNSNDFSQKNLTVVPDDLRDVVTAFNEAYERHFGCPIPETQLRHLGDESICAAIRSNKVAVLKHGGTVKGWTENEIIRLERYKHVQNGRYNIPKIRILAGENSLDDYLAVIQKASQPVAKSPGAGKKSTGCETNSSKSNLSTSHREQLESALSQRGLEAAEATASVVELIFRRVGKDENARAEVVGMIERQFRGDGAQPLKLAVLAAARKAYDIGVKANKNLAAQKRREEKHQADRERFKNCPTRTDERCNLVMTTLGEQAERDIDDIDVDDEDLQYFVDRMTEYWGEDEVQRRYHEILHRLTRRHSSRFVDDDDDFDLEHESIDDDVVRH